jgi:hypothetical protein
MGSSLQVAVSRVNDPCERRSTCSSDTCDLAAGLFSFIVVVLLFTGNLPWYRTHMFKATLYWRHAKK